MFILPKFTSIFGKHEITNPFSPAKGSVLGKLSIASWGGAKVANYSLILIGVVILIGTVLHSDLKNTVISAIK